MCKEKLFPHRCPSVTEGPAHSNQQSDPAEVLEWKVSYKDALPGEYDKYLSLSCYHQLHCSPSLHAGAFSGSVTFHISYDKLDSMFSVLSDVHTLCEDYVECKAFQDS